MFSNYRFRCHALGKIMTDGTGMITANQLETLNELESRVKPLTANQKEELIKLRKKRDFPELSTTCKSYLIEIYVNEVYKRRREIVSKYLEKGLANEEDGITLYSLVKKKFFKKNIERLYNEWIEGEPDLFEGTGNNIKTDAELIADIKNSWDIWTFSSRRVEQLEKKIDKDYWWQLQGYMDLTTARKAELVYCLTNTPSYLIEAEKWKLKNMMGVVDEVMHPEYRQAAMELEISMTFDDILPIDKVITFSFEKDDDAILKLRNRIIKCRQWLNNYHQKVIRGRNPMSDFEKAISDSLDERKQLPAAEVKMLLESTSKPPNINYIETPSHDKQWFIDRIGKKVIRIHPGGQDEEFVQDEITALRLYQVYQQYRKHKFIEIKD